MGEFHAVRSQHFVLNLFKNFLWVPVWGWECCKSSNFFLRVLEFACPASYVNLCHFFSDDKVWHVSIGSSSLLVEGFGGEDQPFLNWSCM